MESICRVKISLLASIKKSYLLVAFGRTMMREDWIDGRLHWLSRNRNTMRIATTHFHQLPPIIKEQETSSTKY